jgi:hypothetical protein
MANVWVGDNYYIKNVYFEESIRHETVGPNTNITVQSYLVKLQRLPESSYSSTTEVFLDSYVDSIEADLSDDDLLAAILPKINTALSTDDSSDGSAGHTPSETDSLIPKL